MDKIKFYYKGEFLGEGDLPNGTMTKDRFKIARSLGINMYDRMQFIGKDGNIRMDSDSINKENGFLSKELNMLIIGNIKNNEGCLIASSLIPTNTGYKYEFVGGEKTTATGESKNGRKCGCTIHQMLTYPELKLQTKPAKKWWQFWK